MKQEITILLLKMKMNLDKNEKTDRLILINKDSGLPDKSKSFASFL